MTTVTRSALRHNGEALRVIREMRGLSRQELASRSRTSYSHLANLELENKVASPELLHRIATALDIPTAALLREPMYRQAVPA